MSKFLGWLSWVVTVRPYITILVLIIITVLLAAGMTWRAPPPETRATLPQGSAVAEALGELNALFGDSGESNVVTLVFRGDSLTPSGLAQMDDLISDIVADPNVEGLLASSDPVFAPSLFFKSLLQVETISKVP